MESKRPQTESKVAQHNNDVSQGAALCEIIVLPAMAINGRGWWGALDNNAAVSKFTARP